MKFKERLRKTWLNYYLITNFKNLQANKKEEKGHQLPLSTNMVKKSKEKIFQEQIYTLTSVLWVVGWN